MITLILVLIFLACVWKARHEDRKAVLWIKVRCAACRGERDGSVLLLPDDADLCQRHYQQRLRIQKMERSLLR